MNSHWRHWESLAFELCLGSMLVEEKGRRIPEKVGKHEEKHEGGKESAVLGKCQEPGLAATQNV